MAFFYANRIFGDVINNKNYLTHYFESKQKFTQPMKMNYEYVLQKFIKDHIVGLPLNYKFILHMITER